MSGGGLFSEVELDALGEFDFAGVIDAGGRSAHVLLPRIRPGLATPPSRLIAPKGTTNFRSVGRGVDISNTAVGSRGSDKPVVGFNIVRENSTRQSLFDFIVPFHDLLQVPM